MKKILFFFLFVTFPLFSQTNGINYQAVIYSPTGQQLPGANNQKFPLSNKTICLLFSIIDSNNLTEYAEKIVITTDRYGVVNHVIGSGTQVGGYSTNFNGIIWNSTTKNLKVELDVLSNCSDYTFLSNEPFTSVPFALYAANAGTPGPAGPQGPQGPQGLTGPAGTTGATGSNGISAYQIAINNGFTGTEQQWLTSLAGANGQDGRKTLLITTTEPAGANCNTGGIKVEVGLDANNNNILDSTEIDALLTKYICNGSNAVSSGGSQNYYQVTQLYNNSEGPFIAASGYGNPNNYPFIITHQYDNLNSKEFDFNLLNARQSCFSLSITFKFYDNNNNLVNTLFHDRESFQSYNTNDGWTNEPIINDIGNNISPIFYSRRDLSNGNISAIVLERNIKFKCQTTIKKIEIIFNTTNVYISPNPCAGCTCGLNNYNGVTSYGSGYFTRIGYQLFSYQ